MEFMGWRDGVGVFYSKGVGLLRVRRKVFRLGDSFYFFMYVF